MSGANRETLAVLLTNLQSPNNEARSQAEHILSTEWVGGGVEARTTLLVGLAELATQGEPSYRPFAAVLLRRYGMKLSQGLERLVDTIPAQARAQIRTMLLEAFVADQTRDTRHKLADAVAEVARTTKAAEPWPELLGTLFQAVKGPNADIREGVFRIFAAVPELVIARADLLEGATAVLGEGFGDSTEFVRIAAVNAFTAFFERLPSNTRKLFKPLLPALLNVAEPLRQSGQSTELTAVFESLIDLAGLAPKMFNQVFMDVINFALAVAADKDLDENTRISALEFATTFADEAPNMCKAEPQYTEKMIMQCLAMLIEVGEDDDDAAEWNNEDDAAALEDEEEVHSAAKASIDRLSLRLEGEAVVPPLFHFLPKMFQSSEWRERHAALMAISNAAEGCRDVMITELDKILDLVLPMLNDPHSRVQWAACNALGQISTDFAVIVQKKYGSRVLPDLISKLSPQSTFRVQAHAAAAIFNFSENASKDILDPYLDEMLNRLLQLLEGPKRYVQEQILATIAIVADAAKSEFIKYYDTMMGLLLPVMRANSGIEYRLLKAKSIECSTLIALAVGKEKFQPQFNELVSIFSTIQQEAGPDDPCLPYLAQAWARLCRIIGPEFLPYLNQVMPSLLTVAKSKADYQILDEEQAAAIDGQDGWEVYQASGQYVGLHTSAFEEKANAIELLRIYASELGADFYPWVADIVENIVMPSLTFYYHDSVRYAALTLIPNLLISVNEAATRAHPELAGKASPDALKIWQTVFEKLLQLINRDESVGIMAEMFTTMFSCIDILGEVAVPDAVVNPLITIIVASMEALRERLQARQYEDNDDFVEEMEDDEAEEEDEALVDASNKLLHGLFKTLGVKFLPSFELLIPVIGAFINSTDDDSVEWAICVIDDLIEYTGPESWKYNELFWPKIVATLAHSNPRLRQFAIYGVGVAAQHGGDAYGQPVLEAVTALFQITKAEDARSDENIVATESAIGAIAKILRSHGNRMGQHEELAYSEWVKTLPIVEDHESASFAYMLLAELIERQHPAVTMQVGHVFYSVAEALVSNTLSGKVGNRIVEATKALLGQLSQNEAMELFHGLSPEKQQIIQGFFQ